MLDPSLHGKDHFYLAPNANESVVNWQSRQSMLEQQQQQQHESQSYNPSLANMHDATLDPMGNIVSNIPDDYFTGLDWMFDDLTDVQAFLSNASEGGAHPPEILDENGGFMEFSSTSPDTTETLNLLNLANTALNVWTTGQSRNAAAELHARNLRRDGLQSGQQSAPHREEDGESSWPQEYRPVRKKPPTIELSALTLPNDAQTATEPDLQDDTILIDDIGGEASASSRWTVSEETRQQLMSYLTHSCRHSWSIYAFNSNPPLSFLTVPQLEKLVELFFVKFHPFVPVIHAATFDPAAAPPVLLLIVITIGLVFYPSEVAGASRVTSNTYHALRKTTSILAVAFSELVRIGVCSAYEADQRGFTDVSINQAWILQQTFGIGSGDKRLNKIAERNRGGIVTAIRRLGLLYQTTETSPSVTNGRNTPIDGSTAASHQKWLAWVANEARLRLGWFVYLYDQKFSCYLDVAPMFRYTEVTSPMPCHADLWNAESASVWMQKKKRFQPETPKTLHVVLRQLLSPSIPSPRLHLNQLEAYILAVTLYRIRWDASKERVLFDKGSLRSHLDTAAADAMQKLSNAAALQTMANHGAGSSSVPLPSDVQLFHLLAKLHFTGPPLFFDKLRDAAGRSGMASKRRQDAIAWLQHWMSNDPSSRVAMRRMLLASSQIYSLERSPSSTARSNKGGIQSNVRTMSLFHAALSMWAYTQFAVEEVGNRNQADDGGTGTPPRISPKDIAALCEKGQLSLNEEIEEADDFHQRGALQAALVEAWVCGEYVSTQDEKVYDWPLPPMAMSIEGIGSLNGANGRASHVLERFAMLLARIEWGLAASFRTILLHMARHALK
jgi:hypothetical protein